MEGYVATRSGTATKTDTPILEIPQAINVVTAEQVQNQGARNLTQALRYTPGLNIGGFTDRNAIADEITSRGFAPTPLYFDGAYIPYAGSLAARRRSIRTPWSASKCSRGRRRCCSGRTSRAG